VQVSNDVRMLLPILVGILAAKWVADAATHSLYHGLLEVCTVSTAEIAAAPSNEVHKTRFHVFRCNLADSCCDDFCTACKAA